MDLDDGSKEMSALDDRTTALSVRADEEVAGGDESEDLRRIRSFLFPPQIPDVDDWGIPPESNEACDPEVEVGDDDHIVHST